MGLDPENLRCCVFVDPGGPYRPDEFERRLAALAGGNQSPEACREGRWADITADLLIIDVEPKWLSPSCEKDKSQTTNPDTEFYYWPHYLDIEPRDANVNEVAYRAALSRLLSLMMHQGWKMHIWVCDFPIEFSNDVFSVSASAPPPPAPAPPAR